MRKDRISLERRPRSRINRIKWRVRNLDFSSEHIKEMGKHYRYSHAISEGYVHRQKAFGVIKQLSLCTGVRLQRRFHSPSTPQFRAKVFETLPYCMDAIQLTKVARSWSYTLTILLHTWHAKSETNARKFTTVSTLELKTR